MRRGPDTPAVDPPVDGASRGVSVPELSTDADVGSDWAAGLDIQARLARWAPAACVIAAVFAVIAVVSVVLVLRNPPENRFADLHVYWGTVKFWRSGRSPYQWAAPNGDPFTYPPFALVLFWPLAAIPEGVVQAFWMAATLLLIPALSAGLSARWPRPEAVFAPSTPWRARALAMLTRGRLTWVIACCLLLSSPLQSDLRFGQISLVVVSLTLADALGLVRGRARGCLIGLAAAIKLTPAVFIVWLLAVGRRREGLRALVTFGLAAAIGAVVLPTASRDYWTTYLFNADRIGDLAQPSNQSVRGMLLRLHITGGVLSVLWLGLAAAVVAVALRRAVRLTRAGRVTHAVVLVGCSTIAASPVSWTHHQVWTVVAGVLLLIERRQAQVLAGFLVLFVMIVSVGHAAGAVPIGGFLQGLAVDLRGLAAIGVVLVGFAAHSPWDLRGRGAAGPGVRWAGDGPESRRAGNGVAPVVLSDE